jgi:basic membrane lipoprotein Med (substrate-binding protein (PBP1-ABC) superfamily)
MTPQKKYPALMAYIADRSARAESIAWNTFRADEAAAVEGAFAAVAQELEQAQADYAATQAAKGANGYPYNSAMGVFLGLPLRDNNEPPRGYYFACQVARHFRLGNARREVEALLANGCHLKIVAARDKATRRPIRFTAYKRHQVHIEGNSIVCRNDKKSIRLSSNWSIETAMEKAAEALRTGRHYGYDPARDDGPEPAMTARSASGQGAFFAS